MNLYFLDANGKEHLVAKGVEDGNFNDIMLKDLERRHPGYEVYYTRQWWDDYFRKWIDFGSHTEFYLLQDENRVLNLVKEPGDDILEVSGCDSCSI